MRPDRLFASSIVVAGDLRDRSVEREWRCEVSIGRTTSFQLADHSVHY